MHVEDNAWPSSSGPPSKCVGERKVHRGRAPTPLSFLLTGAYSTIREFLTTREHPRPDAASLSNTGQSMCTLSEMISDCVERRAPFKAHVPVECVCACVRECERASACVCIWGLTRERVRGKRVCRKASGSLAFRGSKAPSESIAGYVFISSSSSL